MPAHEWVKSAGMSVCILGLLIEVVGFLAMEWWPLRRRLPWSPLDLQSWGCSGFITGALLTGLGAALR